MLNWFDDLTVRIKVMTMVAGAFVAISMVYGASLYALVDLQNGVSGSYQDAVTLLSLVTVGVAIPGVFTGLFVASRLTRPLDKMVSTTTELAAGDLGGDFSGRSRKDEIGQLWRALDVLRANEIERRAMVTEKEAEAARMLRRTQSVCALADIFEQTVFAKVDEVKSASNKIANISKNVTDRTGHSGGRSLEAGEAARLSSQRATEVSEATSQLAGAVNEISQRVEFSSSIARKAVDNVNDASLQMKGLASTVEAISEVVRLISDIASQTNLLALNATIEAARAGEAGRGFAVVANEVKILATQTARATEDITRKVVAVQESAKGVGDCIGGIVDVIRSLDESATAIAGAVQEQDVTTRSIAANIGDVASQSDTVKGNLVSLAQASASGCAGTIRVLWSARSLNQVVSALSVESEKFIERVRHAEQTADQNEVFFSAVVWHAAEISRRFERAVETGDITFEELFDQKYEPIPNTTPQQFRTKYLELTDRLLPDLLEEALNLGDQVVFSAPVDLNGYLPTHNRQYSLPQGPDAKWNDAHCRNRRFFNDKTGLAAGQNTSPLLIQSYRRMLSADEYQLMIDASAPIIVKGRHWGGLRLGFKA